jgi:3-hydroxyisobutyrate dehydrogenase-like beta-hydroxyacid dehydrogenase
MANGRARTGDDELVLTLACGASVDSAAQKAGLSRRTVYRRLEDSAFRARVAETRAEMVRRTAAVLTAVGLTAVKTLTTLQESAVSESVRLGAARATIELGCKMRETVEWGDRLAAIEKCLETILGDPGHWEKA